MKPHLNQSQDLTIKNLIGREDVWMLMSQLNHVYILPVTFSVPVYIYSTFHFVLYHFVGRVAQPV
jgi:hypothetical protein